MVEPLHLLGSRQRFGAKLCGAASAAGAAAGRAVDLVADDLHRHGQIERRVVRIGRNAQQRVCLLQLLVGEPGALGTEHNRHRLQRYRLHQASRRRTRIQHAEILVALAAVVASTSPHPASAVARSGTTRARASRSSAPEARARGLRMRKLARPHQHQLLQSPCS